MKPLPISIFLACCLLSVRSHVRGASADGQHLEPVDSDYWSDAYHKRTRDILMRDLTGPDAFMLCLPSFNPEWTISIGADKRTGASAVEFREASPTIWDSKRPDKTKVKIHRAPIDDAAALAVRDIWQAMLRETRYRVEPETGVDGATYQFASLGFEGQIWSPDEGSMPGQLIGVALILREYTTAKETDRPELRSQLLAAIEQLSLELDRWPHRASAINEDKLAPLAILRGHRSNINHLAFSNDGTQLLTCDDDGTAKAWDTVGFQQLSSFRGHNDKLINGGAICRSCDRAVTTCAGGNIKVWKTSDGTEMLTLGLPKETAGNAVFSPDGLQIVTAQDRAAKLWDARTGKYIRSLITSPAFIYDVCYSPDGKELFAIDEDGCVYLVEVATARVIRQFEWNAEHPWSTSFVPDGSQVAAYNFDHVEVWHKEDATRRLIFSTTDTISGFSLTPTGPKVATWSKDDHYLRVWNGRPGDYLIATVTRAEGPAGQGRGWYGPKAAFSPDGSLIAAGYGDGTVKIWRLPGAN